MGLGLKSVELLGQGQARGWGLWKAPGGAAACHWGWVALVQVPGSHCQAPLKDHAGLAPHLGQTKEEAHSEGDGPSHPHGQGWGTGPEDWDPKPSGKHGF